MGHRDVSGLPATGIAAGHIAELDAQEEAGPADCSPSPADVDVAPGELDEPPHEAQFSVSEEMFEPFTPDVIPMVLSPEDGLPVPANEPAGLITVAPFTYEDVVCVEDDREYVEMFTRDHAYVHKISADGEWTRWKGSGRLNDRIVRSREEYTADGSARMRTSYQSFDVQHRWGRTYVVGPMDDLILVRPRRERCKHYSRQIFSVDGEPDKKVLFRRCMAVRSTGGAFMSLRDEGVYACDHRDPPDPASVEQYLDGPDRRKLNSDDHKVRLPLFGIQG